MISVKSGHWNVEIDSIQIKIQLAIMLDRYEIVDILSVQNILWSRHKFLKF